MKDHWKEWKNSYMNLDIVMQIHWNDNLINNKYKLLLIHFVDFLTFLDLYIIYSYINILAKVPEIKSSFWGLKSKTEKNKLIIQKW